MEGNSDSGGWGGLWRKVIVTLEAGMEGNSDARGWDGRY